MVLIIVDARNYTSRYHAGWNDVDRSSWKRRGRGPVDLSRTVEGSVVLDCDGR